MRPQWSDPKTYVNRIARWTTKFQEADLIFNHVEGENNVLVDLVRRWGNPENDGEDRVEERSYIKTNPDDMHQTKQGHITERVVLRKDRGGAGGEQVETDREGSSQDKVPGSSPEVGEIIKEKQQEVYDMCDVKGPGTKEHQLFFRSTVAGNVQTTATMKLIEIMAENVPDMAVKFLQDENIRGEEKKQRLRALKVVDKVMRDNIDLGHVEIRWSRDINCRPMVPTSSNGWLAIEKNILVECGIAYCIEDYAEIYRRKHLPRRTTQHMYSQMQSIIGKQSLDKCPGLKANARLIGKDSRKRYGTTRYIELMRIVPKAEKLARRFFNIWKYTNKVPAKIRFCRRMSTHFSRKENLEFLKRNARQVILERVWLTLVWSECGDLSTRLSRM
eukprot:augustus_masked-scaffold_22-processed-gene-2.49-mRNA-1 protein AED:1.00 eAED:1.00 QI:0/0/0/0/1/1/5/0/387